jgi:hypothetical protein
MAIIFGYYIAIAPTYILSQIEFETKRYRLKRSITNLMNQPSCTLDATTVLDYTSQGESSVGFGMQNKLKALLLAHLTH